MSRMRRHPEQQETSPFFKEWWKEWWVVSSISDSQRRVFWLLHPGEDPKSVWLYGRLANQSHGWKNWEKRSPAQMENDLRSKMHWWCALELALCEALIGIGNSFHFLPPKELDSSHKIDLCSRVPYRDSSKRIRTFCIGSQITIAPLPWNNQYDRYHVIGTNNDRYDQKYKQIQAIAQDLHSTNTRNEIQWRFWKLTLPDIICYIAVNGDIGKFFSNTAGHIWSKFHEWKRTGFSNNQISEHFKSKIREELNLIAQFIDWTQHYLVSSEFHESSSNNFNSNHIEPNSWYHRTISFQKDSLELSFSLQDVDSREQISRVVYFLSEEDISNLAQKQ